MKRTWKQLCNCSILSVIFNDDSNGPSINFSMIYDTDCVVSKKQKDKKVIQDRCSTNIPDQQSLDGSAWDPATPAVYRRVPCSWPEQLFRLASAFGEIVAKDSECPLYQLYTMTIFLKGHSC